EFHGEDSRSAMPKRKAPPRRGPRPKLRGAPLLGGDADQLAVLGAARLEHDPAFGLRIKRVVAAHAHVGTGVKSGAALAHQNHAGHDVLSAEALHTEALRLRV